MPQYVTIRHNKTIAPYFDIENGTYLKSQILIYPERLNCSASDEHSHIFNVFYPLPCPVQILMLLTPDQ